MASRGRAAILSSPRTSRVAAARRARPPTSRSSPCLGVSVVNSLSSRCAARAESRRIARARTLASGKKKSRDRASRRENPVAQFLKICTTTTRQFQRWNASAARRGDETHRTTKRGQSSPRRGERSFGKGESAPRVFEDAKARATRRYLLTEDETWPRRKLAPRRLPRRRRPRRPPRRRPPRRSRSSLRRRAQRLAGPARCLRWRTAFDDDDAVDLG